MLVLLNMVVLALSQWSASESNLAKLSFLFPAEIHCGREQAHRFSCAFVCDSSTLSCSSEGPSAFTGLTLRCLDAPDFTWKLFRTFRLKHFSGKLCSIRYISKKNRSSPTHRSPKQHQQRKASFFSNVILHFLLSFIRNHLNTQQHSNCTSSTACCWMHHVLWETGSLLNAFQWCSAKCFHVHFNKTNLCRGL